MPEPCHPDATGARSAPSTASGTFAVTAVKTLRRLVAASIFCAAASAGLPAWAATDAGAAPLEAPDPQTWARLSPDEQAARRAELRRQLQAATPAQRQAFRHALRERLETLSPDQRQALIGQQRERWQALPKDERARLAQERRERIAAMSPQERRALLRERRAMLDKLSPAERAALSEKLPAD